MVLCALLGHDLRGVLPARDGEIAIEDNVFRDKDYLCPIYSGTLAEMVNMTQNLGH